MKLVEWMHSESHHSLVEAPNHVSEQDGRQTILTADPSTRISINGEHCKASSEEKYGYNTTQTVETDGIICPFQNYLLATAPPVKEQRGLSLGELFQKSQDSGSNSEDGETKLEKEADMSDVSFKRKMVKKRTFDPPSSKNFNEASGGTVDTLHKIVHMFNKKVHPESSRISDQSHNPTIRTEITNNITRLTTSKNEGMRAISKESKWSFTESRGNIISGKEFWIKTDADYLVLELTGVQRTTQSGSI